MLIGTLALEGTPPITLCDLETDPNLTPERFVRRLADFDFKLGVNVQAPEVFLANRCGDCDDFATLAADILHTKGYTTRLAVVHMRHYTHVVCYVVEVKAYLDFNLRKKAAPLVPSDGTLKDIAAKVSANFHDDWFAASVFTYHDGTRQITSTDFH